MSAIKKIAAIVLAVTVVASSAAIFAGVAPAVELLASIEKEYGKHLFEVESHLLDVAETERLKNANVEQTKKVVGQASK